MSLHNARHNSIDAVIDRVVDAMLEALEPRKLMANDPLTVGTVSSGGTWLNIVGSANDDAIVVAQPAKGTYTITNGTWTVTKKGTFVGVKVAAGAGNDSVTYTGPWSTRVSVLGEAGNDTIVGSALNDVLNGGLGDDSIEGGLGNDSLVGEAGNDTLKGGDGNDSIVGRDGNDVMEGGTGNDALVGETGNDTISGGDGNDSIAGREGDDSLDGGTGNDTIIGEAGNDVLIGGTGNDSLAGREGNDTLNGGADNDTLDGGLNDDSVDGGAGNDKLIGDLGKDVYVGGDGLDTLDYTGRTTALSISLDDAANDGASGELDNVGDDFETIFGGNAADLMVGNDSDNVLNGGIGNDTIRGGGGNDRLYGGVGADSIDGEAGDDSVYGQADNDVLFGGDGADLLEGGAGNDQSTGGAGRDQLIALGGGVLDSLTGGDGLDSYWLDSDVTEQALGVSSEETAARAVHRVKAFLKAGATVVSKEITGAKLADPIGSGKLVNFAANKLFAAGGPSEDDVRQGSVGDCWYMAGLAAIAKTMPEVIRQSITALGDGTYAIRFGAANAEKYVRIDADLYTYSWSATTQSYAMTGAESSTWVPLLEKALTWVRGSRLGNYATISSGWMTETNAFLGLSSTGWGKSSATTVTGMIDWLKQQLDAGKAVTMGTPGVTQTGSALVGGHAYTIDAVVDNGDSTFSVKVRNPWGVDGYGSTDGANDGHLTLAAATIYANMTGLVAGA